MELLVLGGSGFVGRVVAMDAVARGWHVTVLNRGTREAPTGAKLVVGDRTAADGLAGLDGARWDIVVDTWSGAPSVVRDAVARLGDRTGHWTYVSSRSVYATPVPAGADEAAPLVEASADDGPEVDYPRAKAGGEAAVVEGFDGPSLLVRAGLVLGPHEDVGRLPWWLQRIARGGAVVAPGPAASPLQYVDVRDLAAWMLDAAASGLTGPFNAVSRPGHATMGELLDACVRATGSDARLRWFEPEELLAAGVRQWSDLPCWLAPGPDRDFLHGGNVERVHAAGLACRPIAQTVNDTWAWLQDLDGPLPHRADRPAVGLPADLEAALLG